MIQLFEQPDTLLWRWGAIGVFSTKITCGFLSTKGVKQEHALIWWEQKLPMKIKKFMWLLKKNRILTKANLQKKVGKEIHTAIS